jgi:hypothetical protein
MAHWQYVLWGLGGPAGFAAACRYIPRAFLVLIGGLTTSPQRFKQCAEMVRLLRKDAKEIPSYFAELSESAPPPPTASPGPEGHDGPSPHALPPDTRSGPFLDSRGPGESGRDGRLQLRHIRGRGRQEPVVNLDLDPTPVAERLDR